MNKGETIFFTGLTGSLGSLLGCQALKRGIKLLTLMRDKTYESARKRLRTCLEICDSSKHEGLVEIVQGDMQKPGLDISKEFDFSSISTIVNCAGNTEFRDSKAECNHKINVEGTRHVLELATQLNVPVIHVSTAYIAGNRTGTVKEDEVDVGQSFQNSYEESKLKAELLVHQWSQQTKLPATILRPSIVLGAWNNGHTINFMTLYDFMQAFDVISQRMSDLDFRLSADPDSTLNLIPVDWFAKASWHIISKGIPGIYHMTNPVPTLLGQLREYFSSMFGMDKIRFVNKSSFDEKPPTPAERIFKRTSIIYEPYMSDEPSFDRNNTDKLLTTEEFQIPPLNKSYFERLLTFARAKNWNRSNKKRTSSRIEVPPAVSNYFDCFLKEKLNLRLLPNLRRLSATLRIILNELEGLHWTLTIEKGKLVSISRNGQVWESTFLLRIPTFLDIVSGKVPPQEAFFSQNIEIEGDMEKGLHLAAVLSDFFQLFPFHSEKR